MKIEDMKVLAIDTSSKACVLGISAGGEMFTESEILDRTHSKEILPRIVGLLKTAGMDNSELDLIIFGQGPGSFTGLRIGVGVVQGLGFGLDIPVVGVSSIACLAQSAYRLLQHEHSLVALTARLEEVYFGSYSIKQGFAELNGVEAVVDANNGPEQSRDVSWVGIGSGWVLRQQLEHSMQVSMSQVYTRNIYPDPIDLLQLGLHRFDQGLAISALDARPEYLRETVADIPGKKRQ